MSSNYAPIPIIERMSSVMDIILNSPSGVRAVDLLHTQNIPKTTLYRLLTAMTKEGFLFCDADTGVYTIGTKFTTSYVSMDERSSLLRESAIEHLKWLASQMQETVKLSVLSNWSAYVVASIESPQPVRIKIDTGVNFPLHAGATGKIFLCDFNDSMLKKYYQFYAAPYTDQTIMSVDQMAEELKLIKEQGYAFDNGEYMPEILAFAVPIKSQAGNTIAALSLPYPSMRRDHVDKELAVTLLNQTASLISASYSSKRDKESPAQLIGHSVNA
ncbi:MAG: IclR family transcriptional regulator [Lachnospiraceae bacterium]|nr:IclR family transcriptional regulator [Lachnospiraceae bacterium]